MPTTPVLGLPYLAPTDPPNLAGVTQALASGVEAALGVPAAYVPTLVASSSGPTAGSSVYSGRWARIGKVIWCTAQFTIAAGFAAGSGFYQFGLPAPALGGGFFCGSAYVSRSGAEHVGICRRASSTAVVIQIPVSAASGQPTTAMLVGAAAPATPVSGDTYLITVTYEAA